MPDVVGMRLDAAHRALEKLDISDFDDKDTVGDEDSIWRDANWVVVAQEPPAGTQGVDTGITVKLSVGNEDDDEVLELIPADSDFAQEVAEDQAEQAAEEERQREEAEAEAEAEAREEAEQEAEEEAQRLDDAKEYADKVDKALARNVRGVMRLYIENLVAVRANGGGGQIAAGNALAAEDFFTHVAVSLTTLDVAAPDSLDLDDADDAMREAMGLMSQACEELLDAIDTGAPSAFARENRLREEAVTLWNDTMRRVFGAAGRKPVLIPVGP